MGDFIEGVTDDFVGNEGANLVALHNLVRASAVGNSKLSVTTSPPRIQMRGDRASVRFDAILGGGNGRFLPDHTQAYSITSGWRIEAGEWRLYYAQWEPML